MNDDANTYTLRVGEEGRVRLEILNAVHNPSSLRLVKEHGLSSGQSVLDIGCGLGLLTRSMAEVVGPEGRVLGLDRSQDQLDLARVEAETGGLTNIEFFQGSAQNLDEVDGLFDVVFCRFLLCHLSHPEKVLEQAYHRLKPGGILVLEEPAGTDCFACYPPSLAYQRFTELVLRQAQVHGTDFGIGIRLASLVEALGLRVEHLTMYQPLLRSQYDKKIFTLGAVELAPALLEGGFYTEGEMKGLIEGLKSFESDDQAVAAYARVGQVVARKT